MESYLKQLDSFLTLYLTKKAPALPENWKTALVKIIPILVLIFLVLSLPLVLAFFGLSVFLLPISFLGGPGAGLGYTLAVIALAITLILEALSLPGLFNKTSQGWKYAYYAALVNAVYNILTFNLGGLIIGTVLTLYILFQIRSYYK